MSTTRMVILGLVRWMQPVHGYDVRRELVSWEVDRWANIQPGSIYHALRKLTDEGLLAEVATEQVGARPARTTYRVTDAGEGEFQQLLRKYWGEVRDPVDQFGMAFGYLPALPRAEAAAALLARASALAARGKALQAQLDAWPFGNDDKPVHVKWMLELALVRGEAEIGWCRRVAAAVESGEGAHVGEYDVEEAGRRWRESLAEPAE